MNKLLLTSFFIFFVQLLSAQPCDFPFSASNTCATAPLVCSLDGYCSSNVGTTNTGTPNAFCGVVENNSWVSFIAGSTTFELAITVDNCNFGNGLQAQFFSTDDCSFFTAVSNCLNPVFGTANLVCDNLTVGNVYYLMMDGKNNDVCDYQYQLVSGEILSPADVFVNNVETLCFNSTLTINSTAVSTNSNLTYDWSTTNGNILSNTTSSSIEVDAPGIYEIFVEDDQGCSATSSIEVVESPEFFSTISTPDILNCVDNLTEVLNISVDPPNGQTFDFNWTTPSGNIVAGANTDFPEVDQAGWYFVTITNNFGCEKSDSVEVFADVNTPVANAGLDGELNCLASSLELGGGLSSLGINFTYQWTTQDGNILGGGNSITPLVDQPGTYQILVTNTVNGCTSTDEAIVILNEEIPTGANIQIKQPCFGEVNGGVDIIAVQGGIPPYLYSFDGGEVFGSSDNRDPIEPGSYDIVIQDATGCEWETMVIIAPQPELLADLGDDQFVSLGCEVNIQAITNYPIEQIDTVIWSPELDCVSPCLDTMITPLNKTTYTVEIQDINGCIGRDSVTYWIIKDRHVYIPNAFTPNEDGVNDKFLVYGGKDIAAVKVFRVFDRWGELLAEYKDFQPNDEMYSWDGKLNSRRMNENVFIYYAEVEFLDGWIEKYTGDVFLHR